MTLPAQPAEAPYDENSRCERCGRFGAWNFGEQLLCGDCLQNSGSCCPEFGADDLWEGKSSGCKNNL